ncbi:PREDICTED: vesicle-associated protein 2-1-like [Tarenaya hassleriana]|uniref:vesicle-associated protein 2-1-like n=1 Tax=Tarenaya hassleriana TaxID=28532 RepID=UPI00053C5300|nr:PREDICTED: vesicle-associated protein 2-1-like [Tarenaya hassleriana]XP_010538477.1 PREDICTED: vesicle-associated protein 2-1-like [Tarenaya hassleriana]XP_010538478.1 PREDICTED: vesicle-associated protein 2-1-like [Tarenaya hassleriana]XP_010538479.1 PREDICTED: vesicle-associated protein 2-1-like [Tarenaya hassleriana]XP_019057910.1 PREDICTED: vesicle-associated protein 2-1-like [Tarenaya hassleriana]
MTAGGGDQLISVQPDELKFIFELEKQSYCDLKVANKTEHYVAFKVKTTSPKKYFVRPNTGVIQPWDSCIIRVTLQAQREYPLDMQCKDKFLLQSTIVPPHTDVDELPQDTFTKEGGKTYECKLKVSYVSPSSRHVTFENVTTKGDANGSETISTIQRLKEERDAAVKLTQQLQQELETLRGRKGSKGVTLQFAAIVGLVGIIIGYILKFTCSS